MRPNFKLFSKIIIITFVLIGSISNAETNNNLPVVLLTPQEILNLTKDEQIKYLKSVRELVETAEQVQNSFFPDSFAQNSSFNFKNYVLNQLFEKVMIDEAWADDITESIVPLVEEGMDSVKSNPNACIIAGNEGQIYYDKKSKVGRCNFRKEEGGLPAHTCDLGTGAQNSSGSGILCNPALYGNICVPFKSRTEKANATKNCSKKDSDFSHVLAYYKSKLENGSKNYEELNKTINNLRNVCKAYINKNKSDKHKSKQQKKTVAVSDKELTCKALEARLRNVEMKVCKNDSKDLPESDRKVRDFACKNAEKLAEENCQSKIAELNDSKENLDVKCSDSTFSPFAKKGSTEAINSECYSQIKKCMQGHSYGKAEVTSIGSTDIIGTDKVCWASSGTPNTETFDDILKQKLDEANQSFKNENSSKGQYLTLRDDIINDINNSPSSKCFAPKEINNLSDSPPEYINTEFRSFQKDPMLFKKDGFKTDYRNLFTNSFATCSPGNLTCLREAATTYSKIVIDENNARIEHLKQKAEKCLSDSPESKKEILAKLDHLKQISDRTADTFTDNPALQDHSGPLFNDIINQYQYNLNEISDWYSPSNDGINAQKCCSLSSINSQWCDQSQNGVAFKTYGLPNINSNQPKSNWKIKYSGGHRDAQPVEVKEGSQ
jgi:hypothetical protein